jgi:hypothetical protein
MGGMLCGCNTHTHIQYLDTLGLLKSIEMQALNYCSVLFHLSTLWNKNIPLQHLEIYLLEHSMLNKVRGITDKRWDSLNGGSDWSNNSHSAGPSGRAVYGASMILNRSNPVMVGSNPDWRVNVYPRLCFVTPCSGRGIAMSRSSAQGVLTTCLKIFTVLGINCESEQARGINMLNARLQA